MRKNFTFLFISFIFLYIFFAFLQIQTRAATNPTAYWKFDDGSGSTATDSSGNGINGSFTATAPTWTSNVPSSITFNDPYSLDFTGTNDGVTVNWPSQYNFGDTSPRTFSFWYKPVANGEGQYSRILSWSNDRLEIAGTNGTSNSHKIAYFDGNWHETNITLSLGTWYHVTFTYDGTTAKFYIGNDLQDEHALAGRSLSGTLKIGNRVQSPENEGINGYIDDVRIYDYALTASQVSNLAGGSNDPDSPPMTPTPTATIIPTPTITPIPTSTPQPNAGTSQTTSSPSRHYSCTNQKPNEIPDLFQIDVRNTQVILYFAPASNANKYFIAYGNNQNTNQYGVEFELSDYKGIISYTIDHLSPNSKYSFIVRGGNGCMPGDWSNKMEINTTENFNNTMSYFKNFPARIRSLFPREITNVNNGNTALGFQNNTSCEYKVKPGDNLWNISQSRLGEGAKYSNLMKSNKLQSTILQIGQVLQIDC